MITDYEGLRGILDRIPLGILFVSREGDVPLWNEKAPVLLGVDPLDVLDKGISALPADTGLMTAWMALRSEERRNVSIEFARGRRRFSATLIQESLALFDEPCVMILVSDVTEQEGFRELKEGALVEILRRIRGPLTSVKTALSVLGIDAISPLSDAARELVRLGDAEIRRLQGLIGDMSELLTLEGGAPGSDLYLENVTLAGLIRKCVRSAGKLPWGRDREVRIEDGAGPGLTVVADFEKLQLVLNHLLSNALAYSEASRPVVIRVRDTGRGEAEIRVEDEGAGIPTGDIPRIFGKFFRCSNQGASGAEGSGLGLFISRSYADLMGGSLRLESEPGRGTAAVLRLPIPAESISGDAA